MSKIQETSKANKDVDLFGAPLNQVRELWGRRSFAKNKENQRLVSLLVTTGFTQEEIANQLGCDAKTLRKYFSRELAEGKERIRTEMMQVIYAAARKGNSAAASKIIKMIDDQLPSTGKRAPIKANAEKLGKKAALMADLEHTPEGWDGKLPH